MLSTQQRSATGVSVRFSDADRLLQVLDVAGQFRDARFEVQNPVRQGGSLGWRRWRYGPGNAGRGLGAELTVRGVDDLDAGFAQETADGGAAIGGDRVDGEPAGGLAVGDLGDAERLGAAQPDVITIRGTSRATAFGFFLAGACSGRAS